MTWNSEKLASMLKQVTKWNDHWRLRRKNTKLLCPEGCGVRRVDFFKPLASLAVLDCKHERSVEIPLREADEQELIAFLTSPEGRRKQIGGHNRNSVTYVEDLPKEAA